MKQNSVNNLTIDLTKQSAEEIAEFLKALMLARHTLLKKGFKMKVTRRKKPSLKLSK